MKKQLVWFPFIMLLALLIALVLPANVLAQQPYLFSVDKEVVNVYWNSDGTLSLDYLWAFTNQPGAHAIDFIDVGMPNDNFDLSTAKADVDGKSVTVSKSDYQGSGSGFAVVMGSNSIPSNSSGSVHVYIGKITGVLYPDNGDSNYASAVFDPTYFGSQYVVGNTNMAVTFHLPPGVKPSGTRWHKSPSGFPSEPQTGIDKEGYVIYTWSNPSASGSTQYKFGASFPKSYIPDSAIQKLYVPDNSIPKSSAPESDVVTAPPILIGSLFRILFWGVIALIIVGIPARTVIQTNRRKLQYLPPKVSIEGHGIKRGLTAVEAAILMEEPPDKVMTMILFGVVRKGVAEVVTRDPLQLNPIKDLEKVKLHDYEISFLKAFDLRDLMNRRLAFGNMIDALTRLVSEKMKGFSRKETIEYYKQIMETAWRQVEDANTPEIKSQKFEENLEWTILDKNYDDRTTKVFTDPILVPSWWERYDPTYTAPSSGLSDHHASSSSLPSSHKESSGSVALPGADFSASVVKGVQSISSEIIEKIETSLQIDSNTSSTASTSITDYFLSGFGKDSGGSSGSGGCACDCAGCACACAGDGR
jgi:hypothetical protein